MKTKPNGTSFEQLFPAFQKTEEYKVYTLEKQLKTQSDTLNKMIEQVGKTNIGDKLKKLMEYQVKNLADPAVSKQLDMMIEEYVKKTKMGKRQVALLQKQQQQIKDERSNAKQAAYDKNIASGFSTKGLGEAVKGKGIMSGAAAGMKYTGKSTVSSMKQTGLSGIMKGAMHFAGAALDAPALNIIASSIDSNTKKNESMIELLKEFEDDTETKTEQVKKGKQPKKAKTQNDELQPSTINGTMKGADNGLLSGVPLQSDAMDTLHDIDSKIGELLFVFKDSFNDIKSSEKPTGTLTTRTPPTESKSADILGSGLKDTLLAGLSTISGALAAPMAALAALAAPIAALAAGIGAIDTIGKIGKAGFDKNPEVDAKIAAHEGVKPGDVTAGMRMKHSAANAASSMSFGLVKPESFLGDKSKFNAEDKDYMMKMTRHSESKGDYGSASVLKDGAGLTAGAYQFTEKSGSLGKMMESYAIKQRDSGDFSNFLPSDITQGLKKGNLTQEQRDKLTAHIKTQQQKNPEMFKQAQDQSYQEQYLDPAIKMASDAGITDKSAVAMFSDHYVNGGAGGAKNVLKNMQASGIDMSKATAADVGAARKTTYSNLIAAKPEKGIYAKGWNNRVDENLSILNNDNKPASVVGSSVDAETKTRRASQAQRERERGEEQTAAILARDGITAVAPAGGITAVAPAGGITAVAPAGGITAVAQAGGKLPDVAPAGGIDEDGLAKKIGAAVASAFASLTSTTPSPTTPSETPMKKYSLEDDTDKSSWLALTGQD